MHANMKDVPALHRKEEYVLGTEPKLRHVVTKDVPIMPRKEEFVSDMVQKLRHAVIKDVPMLFRVEEFVLDMEPSEQRSRLALMKVVPIWLREACINIVVSDVRNGAKKCSERRVL